MEQEKEQLMNANRKIAEENLAKEPLLIEKKARINSLSEEGVALCASVQEKLEEISKNLPYSNKDLSVLNLHILPTEQKSSDVEEDTIQALLETSAAQTEEESEAIVRQFLDKEIGVDAFLETFMSSRRLMHLRKFKADKMRELIRNPRMDSSSSSSSVPYPMPGGMRMPMPGMYMPH